MFFVILNAYSQHKAYNEIKRDALVSESLLRDSKLSQLMTDHILGHVDRNIVFSVVDHEPDSDIDNERCACQ